MLVMHINSFWKVFGAVFLGFVLFFCLYESSSLYFLFSRNCSQFLGLLTALFPVFQTCVCVCVCTPTSPSDVFWDLTQQGL